MEQLIGIIGAMKVEVDAILSAMEETRPDPGRHGVLAGTLSGTPAWCPSVLLAR